MRFVLPVNLDSFSIEDELYTASYAMSIVAGTADG
jgi:hypothetical protein